MTTLPATILPVICVLGATAAGKTAAALALADKLPVSLISVDSAQVYRGMDIGSAKLEKVLLQQYPHALIDIRNPEQSYSVAEFCHDAGAAIDQAHASGKIPVLVGGTMMYVQALMQGLAKLPPADPSFRKAIELEARQYGWPAMHARLAQIDPQTAARLKVNDAQRIQRALEVFNSSGVTLSAWLTGKLQADSKWRFLLLAISPSDRNLLHLRIAQRVQAMLKDGLIGEVERLRANAQLTASSSSMRSVGYRQIWSMLDGNSSLEGLSDEIIFATRQLAKRQLTWLRQMPGIIWANGGADDTYTGTPKALVNAFFINRVDIFASKTGLSTV